VRENSIKLISELTRRPVNPGAEKWVGVPIDCLDHGFAYLVDYMGDDGAVVQAARVSYGRGTRKASSDRALIRYLMRHRHTTPFEMAEFKFHAKMPIFVARQWIRHRTANVNEYSGRYSILDREFYMPDPAVLAIQSKSNRQGREDAVPAEYAEEVLSLLKSDAERCYGHYEYFLNDNGEGNPVDPGRPMLARELARMGLTLNFYTQWYWKIDLHNLLHFISLRSDPHAQHEIRVYSDAIGRIVADAVPFVWEAFIDYEMEAVRFSRLEISVLNRLLRGKSIEEALSLCEVAGLTNRREREEFVTKIQKVMDKGG
jgi:thymidylate synthase (FAD)